MIRIETYSIMPRPISSIKIGSDRGRQARGLRDARGGLKPLVDFLRMDKARRVC